MVGEAGLKVAVIGGVGLGARGTGACSALLLLLVVALLVLILTTGVEAVSLRGGMAAGEGGEGEANGEHGECGEFAAWNSFGEGGLGVAISAPLNALARVVI